MNRRSSRVAVIQESAEHENLDNSNSSLQDQKVSKIDELNTVQNVGITT